MTYTRGDIITFSISPGENFDPDANDFTARILRDHYTHRVYDRNVVVVHKRHTARQEDGSYRAAIPADVTARMAPGRYLIELHECDTGCIASRPQIAFTLKNSFKA